MTLCVIFHLSDSLGDDVIAWACGNNFESSWEGEFDAHKWDEFLFVKNIPESLSQWHQLPSSPLKIYMFSHYLLAFKFKKNSLWKLKIIKQELADKHKGASKSFRVGLRQDPTWSGMAFTSPLSSFERLKFKFFSITCFPCDMISARGCNLIYLFSTPEGRKTFVL